MISLVPPSSSDATVEDPIRAEHRAVIDLFATQLAKVAFPDVDAALLRRQADEVRAEAIAVARAREALAADFASCAERAGRLQSALAFAQTCDGLRQDGLALAGTGQPQ
jgi:hypothetical protein